MIRRFWFNLTFPKAWNERMIALDRPYAVIERQPLRRRVTVALSWLWFDVRQAAALRIAPWLTPEE